METQRQYLFSIICLTLILSSCATKCEWFEYHDDIMDDCGPCEEICKGVLSGGKVIIGTEKQCKTDCSDFLASKNCTYTEYYDHVVHSCAPCFEMCDQKRGTTCPLQCNMYLKAKNCTQEEYFKIDNSMCSPCSDLCHYDETKGTAKECFDKCPEYVEKNHPGNVMLEPLDLDTDSSSRPSGHSQANSSAVLPVVIAVVVVGIVALVILPVAVYHYRAFKVKARRQDMPAWSTAGYVAVSTPVQQASSLNITGTEPRTNSANNDFNVSVNSGLTQDDGNVAMEMHLLAPSTSTAQPSPWQSARVMNV